MPAVCTFCEIVNGTRHAAIYHRSERFIAFAPATRAPGKLLVVPCTHYESLQDVPTTDLGAWLQEARKLASMLSATSYKMQINVGRQFDNSVRHLFMQFNFTESAKGASQCQPYSGSTARSSPQAVTSDRGQVRGVPPRRLGTT